MTYPYAAHGIANRAAHQIALSGLSGRRPCQGLNETKVAEQRARWISIYMTGKSGNLCRSHPSVGENAGLLQLPTSVVLDGLVLATADDDQVYIGLC